MDRRTLLITGASSGIGFDAAGHMRARGWRVFAACRKAEDCDRLRRLGFDSPRIDYADPDSIVTGLAEVLEATGGRLDALFNNGAIGLPGAVEDLPRAGLRDVFETNVFGVHELTMHAIRVMRAQGHGRIVNNSSVLGYVAIPWRGAYTASKHALEGLTDTLRIEMRDTPIHVALIEPGPVTSRIRRNAIGNFERWIDWEASARAEQYRTSLLRRLYAPYRRDRFELPPGAVSRKLAHALESPRPRARYRVTAPAHLGAAMRRVLPTGALDWLTAKG